MIYDSAMSRVSFTLARQHAGEDQEKDARVRRLGATYTCARVYLDPSLRTRACFCRSLARVYVAPSLRTR